MTQHLKGRAAIVTGAGRGVGRDIALLLAKEGAKVMVCDPGVGRGGEVTTEVQGSFRTAPAVQQTRDMTFCFTTCHDFIRRDDGMLGHRIYPSMTKLNPDFVVHAGDIEYYDKPLPWALTKEADAIQVGTHLCVAELPSVLQFDFNILPEGRPRHAKERLLGGADVRHGQLRRGRSDFQ